MSRCSLCLLTAACVVCVVHVCVALLFKSPTRSYHAAFGLRGHPVYSITTRDYSVGLRRTESPLRER